MKESGREKEKTVEGESGAGKREGGDRKRDNDSERREITERDQRGRLRRVRRVKGCQRRREGGDDK